MPRIKRWHPISHDFNRDPQIIEARKQFGDWIGYAWQECLSIADRNDGIVPGTLDQIASILAPISLQSYLKSAANRVRIFLESALNWGWIVVESDHIVIVNYRKYHRTTEHNPFPSEPDLTRPNLLKKNLKKDSTEQNAPRRIKISRNPEFPEQWHWLEEWVKKQNAGFPIDSFLDWSWWDSVSETCGGISEGWLDMQAAKWRTWIMDNPGRAPTPQGFRKFVSGWLQRAYEKERTKPNGERTGHSNFIRR